MTILTLNQVPNEILDGIFLRLSTASLLRVVRVSRCFEAAVKEFLCHSVLREWILHSHDLILMVHDRARHSVSSLHYQFMGIEDQRLDSRTKNGLDSIQSNFLAPESPSMKAYGKFHIRNTHRLNTNQPPPVDPRFPASASGVVASSEQDSVKRPLPPGDEQTIIGLDDLDILYQLCLDFKLSNRCYLPGSGGASPKPVGSVLRLWKSWLQAQARKEYDSENRSDGTTDGNDMNVLWMNANRDIGVSVNVTRLNSSHGHGLFPTSEVTQRSMTGTSSYLVEIEEIVISLPLLSRAAERYFD